MRGFPNNLNRARREGSGFSKGGKGALRSLEGFPQIAIRINHIRVLENSHFGLDEAMSTIQKEKTRLLACGDGSAFLVLFRFHLHGIGLGGDGIGIKVR